MAGSWPSIDRSTTNLPNIRRVLSWNPVEVLEIEGSDEENSYDRYSSEKFNCLEVCCRTVLGCMHVLLIAVKLIGPCRLAIAKWSETTFNLDLINVDLAANWRYAFVLSLYS